MLILRGADGAETRFHAGRGPHTEYEIPDSLDWEAAWLAWPDGSRATIPAPHGGAAQVIELRPRRFRPSSYVVGGACSGPARVRARACLPAPAAREALRSGVDDAAAARGCRCVQRLEERHEDVARELAQASAAIGRAREGERLAREAVLTALTAARADLRAARAAVTPTRPRSWL